MNRALWVLVLAAAAGMLRPVGTTPSTQPLWVTGYWYSPPVWGGLPVSDIDYSGLTHIVHYGVLPAADGSFDSTSLQDVSSYAGALISAAHSHDVKVLLGVAQTRVGGDFLDATQPGTLDTFISNIMNLVQTYGYDGVDLDWEDRVDAGQFHALVQGLRSQLNALTPRGTLTGAFFEPQNVATIASLFDQINLMGYDLCAVSDGFTWHNAALYNRGNRNQRSVDVMVSRFIAPPYSIPASRLGLGIPFYGYVWRGGSGTPTGGVTGPAQSWTTQPTMRSVQYRAIVSDATLWQDANKRRDVQGGGAPYLSVGSADPGNSVFVTYDDETSIAQKVSYAVAQGMGGVMVYELSGDYLPGHTPQHPLLQAVKTALRPSTRPTGRPGRPSPVERPRVPVRP